MGMVQPYGIVVNSPKKEIREFWLSFYYLFVYRKLSSEGQGWVGILERLPSESTMVTVTDYIYYVILGETERKSWSANLGLPGCAFMNPNLGYYVGCHDISE